MLASSAEPPVAQRGLIFEPKYDGIRALVDLRPGARGAAPHITLYSRNGHNKTRQFPALVSALTTMARTLDAPLLLDGEIVATDADGRPLGFERIQPRIHLTADADIARVEQAQPAALVLFDLLRDGDEDLRSQPLAARRLALHDRIAPPRALRRLVRLSEIATDDGRPMLSRARAEGWEGLIVKDGRSKYYSGRRTPAWRKLRLLKQQEFVVGGWTEPRLSRHHFGALLLGCYTGPALDFAGSVGTGFDESELARIAKQLATLKTTTCPFAGVVKTAEPAHWVKPRLVVEVRFAEWTSDGLLRQPVYLGSRDDKRATQVTREEDATAAPSARRVPGVRGATGDRRATSDRAGDAPHAVAAQLQALEAARRNGDITLPNGDRLRVTNLAKLLWPALRITKGELLRYYVEVASLILPVVRDRPLVMKRFPNGIDGHAFYQQRHPEPVPAAVRREALPEHADPIDDTEGGRERLVGGSLTTLLYMTQLAAISQDPWFSRVADPLYQDFAAIDLDPGDGATFSQVIDVARWVKDELDRAGIPAAPKTSGSRGLHIYIPLPTRTTYETGQLLCHVIATVVSTRHPKIATIERMVKKRPRATIYIDYLQNILGKTLACAYSARASDYAGVSTPLAWAEVAPGLDPRDFTIRTAPARFHARGDLWAALRTGAPVDLKAVLRKMK